VTVGGRAIRLTGKEFGLLACLAKRAGRVVPHEVLLRTVWGLEPRGARDERSVLRVFMRSLRAKIDADSTSPRLTNEPGLGYRLREE
jgi:two-component system KDP operon response regulator KdpE